jgi:hypothetical protein
MGPHEMHEAQRGGGFRGLGIEHLTRLPCGARLLLYQSRVANTSHPVPVYHFHHPKPGPSKLRIRQENRTHEAGQGRAQMVRECLMDVSVGQRLWGCTAS